MSIYSGFATRQQQVAYDENICTILFMMSKRIIKFFKAEAANDLKFIDILMKSFNQLKNMEDSKYLQPKVSASINQLIQFLKIKRIGVQQNQSSEKTSPIIQNKIYTKSNISNQFNTEKKKIKIGEQKTQKLIVTQRIAKQNQKQKQKQSNNKNNIKARVISSSHNRSTDVFGINSSVKAEKKLNDPIFFRTPKAHLYNNMSQSKQKLEEQSYAKMHSNSCYDTLKESKQDVRQLIKGYLAKRKKNNMKQSEKCMKEIEEVFKSP